MLHSSVVYALFAVKLVVHFMEQRDLLGVEGYPLEKSRAFVRACAVVENFLFKLKILLVAHTESIAPNSDFYSLVANFFANVPRVQPRNVYAGNALYPAEERIRIDLAYAIPVIAGKHVYSTVVKP